MLFNSFIFVFAFLPISVIGYYGISKYSHRMAAAWLVLASFVFYAWWNPLFVILLAASIAGNYVVGLLLQAYERRPQIQTAILAAGIGANLCLLCYYKYLDYAVVLIRRLGIHLDWETGGILLPLGISFFTFTQIGYLIDCKTGIAKGRRLLDYALFVTFFPHLIAGPILHHREMMPQFEDPATYKFKAENLAVGLTIFVIGLAKKVLVADQLAPMSNLGFAYATQLGLMASWTTILCYSMQLYFDFSGYSDMAIGLARMFGIRFPLNFNSPYKATSIIDFWQRWHMTLTRYLTLYLYNPIALWVTRRRLAAGKPIASQGATTLLGFASLVAFPTCVTMFLAGVWHGAGTNFAVFGLLHACYLTINHAWRIFGPKLGGRHAVAVWARVAASGALTYLAVLVAQVFFRAPSFTTAIGLLAGMAGLRGWTVGTIPLEDALLVSQVWQQLMDPLTGAKLLACFVIVLGAPNTAELLARYDPILGRVRTNLPAALQWKPSLAW
ncbi:MAG: MBOAT family protein, partial [Acidobacteria bacterium]